MSDREHEFDMPALNVINIKFPGVGEALDLLNQGWAFRDLAGDNITYHVERADRNLMAITPRLLDGRSCGVADPLRSHLYGWQTEVFHTYHNHRITATIGTSVPHENYRDLRTVRHLMAATDKPVDFICRLEITGWCRKDNNNLVSLPVRVTVFREPKQGFEQLLAGLLHPDHIRVNANLNGLQDVNLNPDVAAVLVRVQERAVVFEREVFHSGYSQSCTAVATGKQPQHAYHRLGDAEGWFSTWGKGEVRMGFKRDDVEVTFYFDGKSRTPTKVGDVSIRPSRFSSNGRLAVEKVSGTFPEVSKLLDDVTTAWTGGGLTFI